MAISAPLGLCKITVTKTFAIFLALVLHLVPLAVIVVVSIKMILTLRGNAMCEISAVNERTSKKIRKLLITLILSVSVIFWSPYHCLFLYFVFGKTPSFPSSAVKLEFAFRAGNVWAYFNPLLNALLYYIFSKEFRKGLSCLLARCCGRKPAAKKNASSGPGRSPQELVRFSTKN